MNPLYGPVYEMPPEPSSLIMMLTGIAMVGVYMWRAGLLKERLQRTASPNVESVTAVTSKSSYRYCEYERRFTMAFVNLTNSRAAPELSLTP